MDIRVALFEDNKLIREALQTILNGTTGFERVGVFDNGHHWQHKLKQMQGRRNIDGY